MLEIIYIYFFHLKQNKVSGLIVRSINFQIIILIMSTNNKSSLKYRGFDQQMQYGMNLHYLL